MKDQREVALTQTPRGYVLELYERGRGLPDERSVAVNFDDLVDQLRRFFKVPPG